MSERIDKPERATQSRVVELFTRQLGYRYLGDWSGREGTHCIDEGLLTAFLARSGYSSAHISATLHRLRTEALRHGRTLYAANQAVYPLLRYGEGGGRPGEEVLDGWCRQQLRDALPALLDKWEPLLKVKARRVFVQRMKTRWGRCTPASACIRLNTDLAKKPPECLEYIVVHERVQLLEPTHNERFAALLDLHLPRWQHLRKQLNRLPVRHEGWEF